MSLVNGIETVPLTNFVLAGHSLGGYIVGNYVLKYPQHVSKLIFLSPIGFSPESAKSESTHYGNPSSLVNNNGGLFEFMAEFTWQN